MHLQYQFSLKRNNKLQFLFYVLLQKGIQVSEIEYHDKNWKNQSLQMSLIPGGFKI